MYGAGLTIADGMRFGAGIIFDLIIVMFILFGISEIVKRFE